MYIHIFAKTHLKTLSGISNPGRPLYSQVQVLSNVCAPKVHQNAAKHQEDKFLRIPCAAPRKGQGKAKALPRSHHRVCSCIGPSMWPAPLSTCLFRHLLYFQERKSSPKRKALDQTSRMHRSVILLEVQGPEVWPGPRCPKHHQVTDLDVADLGFPGPRIPFCATDHAFSRSLCFPLSWGGQSSVTRSGIPGTKNPNSSAMKTTTWHCSNVLGERTSILLQTSIRRIRGPP